MRHGIAFVIALLAATGPAACASDGSGADAGTRGPVATVDTIDPVANGEPTRRTFTADDVVVSPAAPASGLYFSDAAAALVPELLDHVASQYPPDDGRFDLIGVSNGGLSAFRAALAMPERFRSLAVFPGYSPDGADDPNLSRLDGMGVAMFVGGDDGGWREASETTQARLEQLGITSELHVIDGQGHILGETLPGRDLFDALERVRT